MKVFRTKHELGRRINRRSICLGFILAIFSILQIAHADEPRDYRLAAGDSIRIVVYQIPDLTLDARVSESGTITYPLIGTTRLAGLSLSAAEQKIAIGLEEGGYVKNPQVNISPVQIVGNQVAVLGLVAKPGSYPVLTLNTRVTQILAAAGGVAPGGGSLIVLTGTRNRQSFRKQIDLDAIYRDGKDEEDVVVEAGDSLYVPKAPMFYIYGEAQRPGGYRLERDMTVRQALAVGGGTTPRGTERGLVIKRRTGDGVVVIRPNLDDVLKADDVLNVRESLF